MQIGSFTFNQPVCSAPMAGVTDKAYRLIAREMGCNLIWTEMISATALTYNNSRTQRIMDLTGESQPLVVQLFGCKPEVIAEAAQISLEAGAQILDINMGCPAPKIVRNGEGSALLKDISLAQRVAAAAVRAVPIPVTVKIRLGWSADKRVGVELAKALESVGIAAIVVHARTREQFYSGKADWPAIAEIKQAVSIPVIGNGDIWGPLDGERMLETTGCDGVMIGRGALGNPWIFKRTIGLIRSKELQPEPDPVSRITMAQYHLSLLVKLKGEKAVQEMRKHAAWYIKGLKGAARTRDLFMLTRTPEEMNKALQAYRQELSEDAYCLP